MTSYKLNSDKRQVFGRKVKSLRNSGKIPANIFGKNIKSEAVSVEYKEFDSVFKSAGETQIIDLSGKPVLVSNVHVDPTSGDYLHVDFRQIDLKEKITAHVPVEIVGESPAEKQSLGTVVQQLDEIEVEALPTDLPEKIEVDQSVLTEVDQAIFVKDLKIDKKISLLTDLESIVVKVEPPQKEEVIETPTPVEEGEGETTSEGETPTEDESKPEDQKEESNN